MSWLDEDADMLDFALEMIEGSTSPIDFRGALNDEEESAAFSLSDSDTPVTPSSEVDTSSEIIEKPRKKKNRGRRREEILLLREKVETLQLRLSQLKIQRHKNSALAVTRLRWEEDVKRQLASRSRSELHNARLRASLLSNVKTAQRLTSIFDRSSRMTVSALQSESSDPVVGLRSVVKAMVPLVNTAFESFFDHTVHGKVSTPASVMK